MPSVFLYAFDLLELNGRDLRHEPIEVRKAELGTLICRSQPGIQLSEHIEEADGALLTPASSGSKASSRNVGARDMCQDGRRIGSSSKIHTARRSCGNQRKSGVGLRGSGGPETPGLEAETERASSPAPLPPPQEEMSL